jgi:membrane-anchored protein YejM (alkaline phosphatase superfamily)
LQKWGSVAATACSSGCLRKPQAPAMENTVRYLTMLAALAVFLVLLAGLWNMMRGTSPNLSQKLMRWRVGLQFLAIVIAMLLVYFWRT